MIEGVVARISGPVVMAQHMRGSKMYDVVKVGDEICMFRHEKKFFNPNVFAVAIKARRPATPLPRRSRRSRPRRSTAWARSSASTPLP
jgi:CO dehydrogenase/acetyl-CoA synthase gamma subunit (corrinoid Fe-S protein)